MGANLDGLTGEIVGTKLIKAAVTELAEHPAMRVLADVMDDGCGIVVTLPDGRNVFMRRARSGGG